MSQPITRTSWLAVMVASAAGFGLLLAPTEQTDRVRAFVRDGALPGLWVVDAAYQQALTLPARFEPALDADDDKPQGEFLAERDEWEQRYRELQTINMKLARELKQARAGHGSPYLAEPGTPLFVPELIEATVIGAEDLRQATQRVSFRRVVDVGTGSDVIPADFVVNKHPEQSSGGLRLIDQGTDRELHADQPVFAGRCVVGQVGQVGRWTSTVVPVTDVEFRGRAQLVRSTSQGLVLGAEGVITGDGQGECLLQHIDSTEPVSVGDEVYTNARHAELPVPMYYGRVVKATLPKGAPHWEIRVKPAQTLDEARVVQVLRSVLNTVRTEASADHLQKK